MTRLCVGNLSETRKPFEPKYGAVRGAVMKSMVNNCLNVKENVKEMSPHVTITCHRKKYRIPSLDSVQRSQVDND